MPVKVLLANPRGFCAGVHMAVETVDEALDLLGPPLYVFHEIVHNRHVVERFESRGVVFVDSIDEVPEEATVIFSAHGVSPEVRRLAKARHLRMIDATCPLVTKVHMEAIRYAKQGYHILLVGHEGHDEVVGTVGEAPDSITVVESPEDVAALPFLKGDKLAYLTQTTLSLDDATRIITALRKRYPNLKEPPSDDICYATTNRQVAVRDLAQEADVVLVVGSQNSSNSVRLTEISEATGTPAHLIDDVSELRDSWFDDAQTVLVTAGASAPEDLVDGIVNHLVVNHAATVEPRQIVEENVHFNLPQSVRVLRSGSATLTG